MSNLLNGFIYLFNFCIVLPCIPLIRKHMFLQSQITKLLNHLFTFTALWFSLYFIQIPILFKMFIFFNYLIFLSSQYLILTLIHFTIISNDNKVFQPTNHRVGLEFYTSNIFKLVFCLATDVFLLRIVNTTIKVCMGTWWGDLATHLKATCSVGWWFFVALWLVKFPPPPGCTCNFINSLRWWRHKVAVDVVNISFVTAYM